MEQKPQKHLNGESESNQPTGPLTSEPNNILAGYQIGQTLGKGTFGKVKLGRHILTGEKVAVKILEKNRIANEADRLRVERQIQILRKLRHPNIMQLYEIIETQKRLYLITQFAQGGELFDYIVSQSRLQQAEASRIFQQLLNAVQYLHKLGIVHRDLKPQNLLLDRQLNVKVVDFGLSNIYAKGQQLRTACGSPCYAAPEMVTAQPYNGLKTDIWSSGIVLYAMVCGYLPFDDPNTAQLYRKIAEGNYELPEHVSQDLRSVLKLVLNTNPERRASIKQIRQHLFCYRNPVPVVDGIIVGLSSIPIEQAIVHQLKKLKVNTTGLEDYLHHNKHNSLSASYYLLLQRKLNESGSNILNYFIQKQCYIHRFFNLERMQDILGGKNTSKALSSPTRNQTRSASKKQSKSKDSPADKTRSKSHNKQRIPNH